MNRELLRWKAEQEKKFKDASGRLYPPEVRKMLAFHGRKEGYACGRCMHMKFEQMGQTCTKSSANHWKIEYPACGLYCEWKHWQPKENHGGSRGSTDAHR